MPDGGLANFPPSYRVIPAKAGIQDYQKVTGFRLGAPRRPEWHREDSPTPFRTGVPGLLPMLLHLSATSA